MNNKPLISIITVSYNSRKTISRTIESVLNQTYTNIEYIIIDGLSNDGTINIIKEYEKKFNNKNIKYKWVTERDNGIYDAMNKGIEIATGEIIGIINSDDFYELTAIENLVYEYNRDESYDVYHGIVKYYDNNKLTMIRASNEVSLKKHMIEHPGCFVKKDIYREMNNFDCSYKYAADYDFLCKLSENKKKFLLFDKIVANFFDGGAGDCLDSAIEAIKIQKKYGYINRKKFIYKIIKEKLVYFMKGV